MAVRSASIPGLILILVLSVAAGMAAQEPPNNQAQSQAAQAATSPVLSVDSVIVRVKENGTSEYKPSASSEATLGQHLRLKVANLAAWIKAGNSPWNLILFLNERPMKGLQPIAVDPENGYLDFHLERRGDNIPTWNALMSREKNWKEGKVSRVLRASIGTDGGVAVKSNARFEMVFLPRLWLFVIVLVSASAFCALVVLGRKTALLRDTPDGPYSLARTQMAVWAWLTLNAYAYLYLLTLDPGVEIPTSILGVMGISATTYLAAAMVDRTSSDGTPEQSHGFIRDLTGGAAVSLHRVQMMGWTLVLALIFIAQVLNTLSIPDFNPTLLGLMGLSAGTYVGFKFPENQAAQSNQGGTARAAAAGSESK
ncbi:MAG TPA: hypothetical protein VFP59_18075 [Candidatus Angelobacter sp.]|nr:hypothetical protein [Candidatus Angelobacter sp.]